MRMYKLCEIKKKKKIALYIYIMDDFSILNLNRTDTTILYDILIRNNNFVNIE